MTSTRKLGRIHQIASADGWLAVYHDPKPDNERAVFTEHLQVWALVEDLDLADVLRPEAVDDNRHLAVVGMVYLPGDGYEQPAEAHGNFLGYTRAESMTKDIEAMFRRRDSEAAV